MYTDRVYKPTRKNDASTLQTKTSDAAKPTLNLQRALAAPETGMSAAQLLQLQQTVGNRQTRQLIGSHSAPGSKPALGIQPKLSIHAPNDPYEHEADQAAARAISKMNSSANENRDDGSGDGSGAAPLQLKTDGTTVQRMEETEAEGEELQLKSDGRSVQRMESPEEEGEELQMKSDGTSVQRMESPEEEGEELQMKTDTTAIMRVDMPEDQLQMKVVQKDEGQEVVSDGSHIEKSINDSLGKGSRLPHEIQAKFEDAMGADFSNVTIHTDDKSDQLSKSLGARAFTTGEDIYFRQGEFNPASTGGKQLLGHELAHVVQQKKM